MSRGSIRSGITPLHTDSSTQRLSHTSALVCSPCPTPSRFQRASSLRKRTSLRAWWTRRLTLHHLASCKLTVFGRQLHVPHVSAQEDACMFSFQQLCEESPGLADYLTPPSTFRTNILLCFLEKLS
ncbi:hypothetical protein DFS33DRAFT_863896 [Desarmillaria ectypa]|nr:hypothetical protein DFS33DRAFT_863896 [Desarmillaria ectypa]